MIAPDNQPHETGSMNTVPAEEELQLWARLKCAEGVGPKTVAALLKRFGDLGSLFAAPPEAFDDFRGKQKVHAALHDPETERIASRRLAEVRKYDLDVVPLTDPVYPPRLARIEAPPTLLFVRGSLPKAETAIAIVGSRNPSPEGEETAYDWAAAFARVGIPVISGLARGIDGAAHRGAVSAGGPTVGVLGCGPDQIYPPEHDKLAEEILATGGALISEFWPGTPPDVHLFPVRNRTISGLAEAVIVVEAAAKSGALLTAAEARNQGRQVYAVPGPLSRHTSAGANRLLQQGAEIALAADDIIKRLGACPVGKPTAPMPKLPADLAAVFAVLDREGRHVDWIARQTGRPAPVLLNQLLALELRGVIKQLPGKRFVRTGE